MWYIYWLLGIACFVILLVFAIAYICFRLCFYVSKKNRKEGEGFAFPPGEVYKPYHSQMERWNQEVEAMDFRLFSIRSHDGLLLTARYYEYAPGAPMEIMFHGYRGNAMRDLCGGVQRCFALGRNVLLVDQRGAGTSQGNVITFGVLESRDCLAWANEMVRAFGEDVQIILTGISMGAATVLTAAEYPLPSQVKGILADCGYTSAREIIQKVMVQLKLPPKVMYPFVKLGARVFGKFKLDSVSPIQAVVKSRVPILFFHGDADDFVPHWMSQRNFEVCTSPKRLVLIAGAGHGLAYPASPEEYLKQAADFFSQNGVLTKVELKR